MPAPSAACSERFSATCMRVGPPWIIPLFVTQSAQSMPSVRPLIQIPPSETGLSSSGKSLLYVLTDVCEGRSGMGLLRVARSGCGQTGGAGPTPAVALP